MPASTQRRALQCQPARRRKPSRLHRKRLPCATAGFLARGSQPGRAFSHRCHDKNPKRFFDCAQDDKIIVVILRVDGIASNAMASAARSPLTVTGSPGISTRFPIIPARAGHCCVVIIISALWVFVNADEKRAPPIRMTPHKVRCLSGRASWTGCRTPRRPAAQSP